MTFLSPLTLIGLLLAALPVVIHLLVRRRAERLDFPSLRFLRETPSFKLRPKRIRQPLLLALRVAAIILLVMGFARPLFTLHAGAPAAVRLILMDASLSMKARGRAEAAKEQARLIVNKLPAGMRASVIAFSSEATTLIELTADRNELLQAIERYRPAGGAAIYSAGLAEIEAQLKREPQAIAQVDLISDFQQASFEAETLARAQNAASLVINTHPVGSQLERNAFMTDETAVRTERGLELSVSEIVSETDGRSGVRRTWTIEGSEGTRADIEWSTQSNDQLTGRIKNLEPDEFDADDERFFAFMPPGESRVLLIEDGGEASLFLHAALEAAGSDELGMKIRLDSRRELPSTATELDPYSLVVLTLRGAASEKEIRTLVEYARGGGSVWLCLARDIDTSSWNAFAGGDEGRDLPFTSLMRLSGRTLHFGTADVDASLLRALDEGALDSLRSVSIHEGFAITPRERADILLRWQSHEPSLVATRVGEGWIALLATSPERAAGNFGASAAFPVLAASMLRAAVKIDEPLSRVIGEAVDLGIAPTVDVKLTDAAGRVQTIKARELVRHPLLYSSEPGIYKLEFEGVEKFVAFNAPAVESERALATATYLEQQFPASSRAENVRPLQAGGGKDAAEGNSQTWRYFLAAAFLLMMAELLLAMRQRKESAGVSE